MGTITDEARQSAIARFWASAATWPVEKSKLIYQGRRQDRTLNPNLSMMKENAGNKKEWAQNYKRTRRYQASSHSSFSSSVRDVKERFVSLPMKHHLLGVISSSMQRGGSAFLMFYSQSHVHQVTKGMTGYNNCDHAMAGALSGLLSAPFHTYWELIKVRGAIPNTIQSYLVCLRPMLWRHSVFDGTFFGVNAFVSDVQQRQMQEENSSYPSSSGFRFALSAASASFANLWFDVWKTRQMKAYPKRVHLYRSILVPMHMMTKSFWSNYLVKGTDLSVNWFVVGCIKDYLFPLL